MAKVEAVQDYAEPHSPWLLPRGCWLRILPFWNRNQRESWEDLNRVLSQVFFVPQTCLSGINIVVNKFRSFNEEVSDLLTLKLTRLLFSLLSISSAEVVSSGILTMEKIRKIMRKKKNKGYILYLWMKDRIFALVGNKWKRKIIVHSKSYMSWNNSIS